MDDRAEADLCRWFRWLGIPAPWIYKLKFASRRMSNVRRAPKDVVIVLSIASRTGESTWCCQNCLPFCASFGAFCLEPSHCIAGLRFALCTVDIYRKDHKGLLHRRSFWKFKYHMIPNHADESHSRHRCPTYAVGPDVSKRWVLNRPTRLVSNMECPWGTQDRTVVLTNADFC